MFAYRSFWIIVLLKIVSSATISNEDIDKILGTRTDLGTDGGTDGYPSMADIDELKMRLGAFAGLQDEPNDPGDILESRENEDEEGLRSGEYLPLSDQRQQTSIPTGNDAVNRQQSHQNEFERNLHGNQFSEGQGHNVDETVLEAKRSLFCNRRRGCRSKRINDKVNATLYELLKRASFACNSRYGCRSRQFADSGS